MKKSEQDGDYPIIQKLNIKDPRVHQEDHYLIHNQSDSYELKTKRNSKMAISTTRRNSESLGNFGDPLSHIESILNLIHDQDDEEDSRMGFCDGLEYHSSNNNMKTEDEEMKIENLAYDKKRVLNQSDEQAIQIIDRMFTGFVSESKKKHSGARHSVDYNDESIGKWLKRLKCGDFESIRSYNQAYGSNETEGLMRSCGSKFGSNLSDIEIKFDSKHFLYTSQNTSSSRVNEAGCGKYSSYLRNKMIAYSSRKGGDGHVMKILQKMVKVLKHALRSAPEERELEMFKLIQGMFADEGFQLSSLSEEDLSYDEDPVYSEPRDYSNSDLSDFPMGEQYAHDQIKGGKFDNGSSSKFNYNQKESILSEHNILTTTISDDNDIPEEVPEVHEPVKISIDKHEYFSFKKLDSMPTSKDSRKTKDKLSLLVNNHYLKFNQSHQQDRQDCYVEREPRKPQVLMPVITNRLDSIIETSHDASSFFEHKGSQVSKNTADKKRDIFFEGNFTLKEEMEKGRNHIEIIGLEKSTRSSLEPTVKNRASIEPKKVRAKSEIKPKVPRLLPKKEEFNFNGFLRQVEETEEEEMASPGDYESIKVVERASFHSYAELSEPKSIQSWKEYREVQDHPLQPVPCHLPHTAIDEDNSGPVFAQSYIFKRRMSEYDGDSNYGSRSCGKENLDSNRINQNWPQEEQDHNMRKGETRVRIVGAGDSEFKARRFGNFVKKDRTPFSNYFQYDENRDETVYNLH